MSVLMVDAHSSNEYLAVSHALVELDKKTVAAIFAKKRVLDAAMEAAKAENDFVLASSLYKVEFWDSCADFYENRKGYPEDTEDWVGFCFLPDGFRHPNKEDEDKGEEENIECLRVTCRRVSLTPTGIRFHGLEKYSDAEIETEEVDFDTLRKIFGEGK